MLKTIPREGNAYTSIYHGRKVGLKVSGKEVDSPNFPRLIEDVEYLNANGVGIVMAVGGGEQISRHYGKPRQKIDEVAVTTPEVMAEGVLPAYEELRLKLGKALPRGIILEPEDMVCERHPDQRFGLVGIPTGIAVPDEPLVIVGFVGNADGQRVNVNADDVAMRIATQYQREIEELIFLTETGGVLANDGRVVSLLTDGRIEQIISGEGGDITADGGMKKKLIEVRRALQAVSKVVITKTAGLRDEIEQWMGSGTLCVDQKKLERSRMRFIEHPIFDAVHASYVEQGIFRPRTPEQIDELKMHHRMVRAGNSPLGGYSLVPRGEWIELSGVWAGTIGNGVGRLLLDSALAEAGRRKMYALSAGAEAIRAFDGHGGFENAGTLAEARVKRPSDVPASLAAYDTNARNPRLFLARKQER